MCILSVALGVSNEFPLIVASNRDEYLSRPSADLGVSPMWQGGWDGPIPRAYASLAPSQGTSSAENTENAVGKEGASDRETKQASPANEAGSCGDDDDDELKLKEGILCGTDKVKGGTWLGLHVPSGRFAVVLNCGGPNSKLSRGWLVRRALEQGKVPETVEQANLYNGFNLVYSPCVFSDAAGSGAKDAASTFCRYITNKDPPGVDSNCKLQGPDCVFSLANDRLGDEHVKSVQLDTIVRFIGEEDNQAVPDGDGADAVESELEHMRRLRDTIADSMLSQTAAPMCSRLSKCVKFGGGRRVQPGFRLFFRFLLLTILVSVGAIALVRLVFGWLQDRSWTHLLFSATAAGLCILFGVAWNFHSRLQDLGVDLTRYEPFGSRAQTMILRGTSGRVYYSYRNVVLKPASGWRRVRVATGWRGSPRWVSSQVPAVEPWIEWQCDPGQMARQVS